MIDQNDLQKIGEEMGKVLEQNITPQFEEIRGRLDKIESTMVTKSYLDDKLADLEGNLVGKLRKEDEKVNRLIEVLKNKSVLDDRDVKMLEEFHVFPRFK